MAEIPLPELHPFDPRSNRHTWVPASYTPDTWPTFESAPVGNHLYVATVSHLYRFYDANKALLYVGVTTNPMRRWAEHRNGSWWRLACFVALEPVPPSERLQREQQAIENEHPQFNRMRPSGRTAQPKRKAPARDRPEAAPGTHPQEGAELSASLPDRRHLR